MFERRGAALVLFATLCFLFTGSAFSQTTVNVCGQVTSYTAATATQNGLLTIGVQPFVIAAGTTLTNSNLLTAGASVCLSASLNASGQITAPATITGGATTAVSLCGIVSSYTAATSGTAGSVTIAGRTLPIMAGTVIGNEALIKAGADLCLNGTLNATGQLMAPSSVSANVATAINVCGTVTSYTAATASAAGQLAIGGHTIPIAAGTTVNNANLITNGANLCLSGNLNSVGQLVAPASVSTTTATSVRICGILSSATAATATAPGSLTIGGQTFPIAIGTTVQSLAQTTLGSNVCLRGTLNASGQLVAPSSLNVTATGTVSVCGFISAYTAATATAPGSITIAGRTFPIAAGTTLSNAALATVSSNVCLSGTVNASGALVAPSSLRANGGAALNFCGVVTQYTAATPTTAGSITIAGQTLPIAAGTSIANDSLIQSDTSLCLSANLNASGQIVAPSSVSADVTSTLSLCGTISDYSAATAKAAGSITIAGRTLQIAPGTTITNADLLRVGANICLNASLNASGAVVPPSTVSANASSTVSICGVVSAYTASTSTTAGSITIGGPTIPIAAGTTLGNDSLITLGANLCLNGTLNAAGQLVVPSSVTASAATMLNLCGVITSYTAATSTSSGSITIAGQTFPIAAGTAIGNSGLLTLGANVCLSATQNTSGAITTPSSASLNSSTTVTLCGVVTEYTEATTTAPGSITIGGQTFAIAIGSVIGNSNAITSGANLCLNGTVNASGQLVTPSTVRVNGSATVSVCGQVTSYIAATATQAGSIVIGGQFFTIAPGSNITGAQLAKIGANFCLTGSLDASGRLIDPTSVSVNEQARVEVCGTVQSYTAATATAPGSITIGGQTFSIAANTTLVNADLIRIGARFCLSGIQNVRGELIPPTRITAEVKTDITVCGVVSSYTAATSTTAGSITINDQTIVIAVGTTLTNDYLITIGGYICIKISLDATGRIIPPSTVVTQVVGTITLCGRVTAFTPATATQAGSITIGGRTIRIAPGVSVNVIVGTDTCLTGGTNTIGELIPPITPTGNPPPGPGPGPGSGGNGGPGGPGTPPTGSSCVGHEPILSVPALQLAEVGKSLRFRVVASDADRDAITLSVSSLPPNATFNAATGLFEFTPANSCDLADETYQVTFTATDARGASEVETVQIAVVGSDDLIVRREPIVSVPPARVVVNAGDSVDFAVAATAQPSSCSIQAFTSDLTSAHGSFDAATGNVHFVAGSDESGTSRLIRFSATDCLGHVGTAFTTVIIRAVDNFGHLLVAGSRMTFTAAKTGSWNGSDKFTLLNSGAGYLRIASATLMSGNDFSIEGSAGMPIWLASGQRIDIKVDFSPRTTQPGSVIDTLRIVTNDASRPVVDITLEGSVTP